MKQDIKAIKKLRKPCQLIDCFSEETKDTGKKKYTIKCK